jgi:sialic acid synthase SpsE
MMKKTVQFGRREIGTGRPTYVIAEIGSNHDQSLDSALEMIVRAAEAGADAVKFQSIRFDALYHPLAETGVFRDWFAQIELDEAWYPALAERASAVGVDFLSAPTYERAIGLLQQVGVPGLKLASPQVQGNLPLLRTAAATGLPLILSMGYADYGDIQRAVTACQDSGNSDLILLHCVSKYPAAPADADLGFIPTLQAMTGLPVGYSDHTMGSHMAVAAVTMGACVIEKHVTTDRGRKGPDHHFSLLFEEFVEMVRQIREVEQAVGDGTRLRFRCGEEELRNKVQLKAVAVTAIAAGQPLAPENIRFLRAAKPGLGMDAFDDLSRYCARHDIHPGTVLNWDDLQLAY